MEMCPALCAGHYLFRQMTELTLEQALKLGIEAHQKGDLHAADRYYTAILNADPNQPDANHNLGILAVGLGKLSVGIPYLKTALELSPSTAQFWVSLIDAYIKQGALEQATNLLEKADASNINSIKLTELKLKLESNCTYSSLFTISAEKQEIYELIENGQFETALKISHSLLRDMPQDIDILNFVAHIQILTSDIASAEASLQELEKLNAKNLYTRLNKTRILLRNSKLTEALGCAKSAYEASPKAWTPW